MMLTQLLSILPFMAHASSFVISTDPSPIMSGLPKLSEGHFICEPEQELTVLAVEGWIIRTEKYDMPEGWKPIDAATLTAYPDGTTCNNQTNQILNITAEYNGEGKGPSIRRAGLGYGNALPEKPTDGSKPRINLYVLAKKETNQHGARPKQFCGLVYASEEDGKLGACKLYDTSHRDFSAVPLDNNS
ncbi:hypothetical protein BCR37DRAFT_161790 [Protomyces lactucae-debilis]|uniref:Uncharacterized protein n=1 Tax=Protomyces lactucae-debilis TaxID=2754530 RepID=A0A1Y2EYN8_PROLT|nr:uncharacterized protein BCR37DRAFT_161790 [Protomyces lactucae-debilis]ORY76607.1 hypothetical protein BCR37DRAFT_161790 [Protomyces lactucae-debilis]